MTKWEEFRYASMTDWQISKHIMLWAYRDYFTIGIGFSKFSFVINAGHFGLEIDRERGYDNR